MTQIKQKIIIGIIKSSVSSEKNFFSIMRRKNETISHLDADADPGSFLLNSLSFIKWNLSVTGGVRTRGVRT